MDTSRVAVVRSGGARGSGYVLGARLVLTAAHVLGERERVTVQVEGGTGRVPCRVVWDRLEEGPQGWDAALLLATEDLVAGPVPPVRWGRLVTMRPCPAQAIGYPVVGQAGGDAVSRVHRDGRVLPETGRDRDRYVLVGDAGAETYDGASPWSGMSGAALWCGSSGTAPLLTGLVTGDPPGLGHTRLEAVPAYVLASDPRVRELVEEHTGRPLLLEPADLQHVTDRTATPRAPRSPADLLRPEQAVVSFMGREELLGDLTDWCLAQPTAPSADPWSWETTPVRVRLLTGAGGTGKTRLAAELALRMTARGWTAIRLTPDATVRLDALSQVRRPLLVVVDYAETRTRQLHALLEAVDHGRTTYPVRVVALARAAGEWWTRATEHPHGHALATAVVTPVPALHRTRQDRAAAYACAVADFTARLRRLSPATEWTATTAPPLTAAEFDNPLSVQMAALLSLLDPDTPRSRENARTVPLEGRLLGHEHKYWDDTADSPERALTGERTGPETRALAVALSCLAPAADRDEARTLLSQLPGLADESAAAVRGALATWLADLYPTPTDSVWGSLQPDRLAEYHVGAELSREPALFTRVLTTLTVRQSAQALTVLARTAQHPRHHEAVNTVLCGALAAAPEKLAPVAMLTAQRSSQPGPLITALTRLVRTTRNVRLLPELSDRLPLTSLALDAWAAELSTVLTGHHDSEDPDPPLLAGMLNNHSVRLAGLGRREEALAASTRAVQMQEALDEEWPGVFLPALATSLTNRSNHLAELGRWEEALAVSTRALEIRESLTAEQPDASLSELAGCLNNHARHLAQLGRRKEALKAGARACKAYEELAGQRPEIFLPFLAASLNSLSTHLAGLERREEALTISGRALGIAEALARMRPDAHLPRLATSLHNRAGHLSELGRLDEALTAITRAVGIRESLAAQQPETYLSDLADSLSNQSNHLADLGRLDEALTASTRAVEIHEKLAARQPDAFLAHLTVSLNNQSNHLDRLRRPAEALSCSARAVEILEELDARHPDAFLPDLATSLANLAIRLSAVERPEEAVIAGNRAIGIREKLAAEQPDVFLPDLATSLNNQANDLARVGRDAEALDSITRAAEILEELAAEQPDTFLPDLARTLNNQASHLIILGLREEALPACARAAEIREKLAARQPDAFLPDLAMSLNNLSIHLAHAGRLPEALSAIGRVVGIYENLAARHPDAFAPNLAKAHALRDLLTSSPPDAAAP
ncbi:trypsin-like peptidase domain-containing protein [Streptomyces sp. NPDC003656]